MNAEREKLIKEIFADALEKADAVERAAYLAQACGQDAELRGRVEALLSAYEMAGGFLEESLPAPDDTDPATPVTEKAGDKIGPYKLLQAIGEGGCGLVYMAEQTEPIRRRVALKVIKLGMDTKQVIARFEAERQALALMDHPNIARVFDGGSTETGRPYFVMELVRGVKLTDYCDQNNFSTNQRLDLVVQVCHAIQHAHQKGIIHRDVKPSNILVTEIDGQPVPKIIDFGIAKAIGQKLTEKTFFTAFEQFVGTPAYMSPEQTALSGADIDTRSDIYSLGVLLYELLTGHTPFDAKTLLAAGLDEMRRIIRETDPPRPSTALSSLDDEKRTTVAKRRQADPPKLIYQVRGDLDWIVMKCLEKDRNRRYETANSLAEDLERHLHHEPVTAAKPTLRYRVTKFARRNRTALVIGLTFVLLLVAGTVVSTWVAVRAIRAERVETLLHLRDQADALGRRGQWREAAINLRQVVRRDPSDPWDSYHLAVLLVQEHDEAGHEAICRRIISTTTGITNSSDAEWAAKVLVLAPGKVTYLEAASRFADLALLLGRDNEWLYYIQCTKGLVEYRQGHFSSAVDWLHKAIGKPQRVGTTYPASDRDVFAQSVLAMALHKLNRSEEARAALESATEVAQTKLPSLQSQNLGPFWRDWLLAHLLLREATELIEKSSSA